MLHERGTKKENTIYTTALSRRVKLRDKNEENWVYECQMRTCNDVLYITSMTI